MRATLLVLLGVGAVLLLGVAAGGAGADTTDDHDAVLQRGGAVFQRTCAACHGTRGGGQPGAGQRAGPAIDDLHVAHVDLMVRTGRMPIAAPEVGVVTDRLAPDERDALVAWMQHELDLPGEVPVPGPGDPGRGLQTFVRHCAACHGAGGSGGVAGGRTYVPPVQGLDPVVIASAARVGPDAMPAFSPGVLSDAELDDAITYLQAADTAPRTLLGLRELTQVGMAVAAVALLAAATLVLDRVADRRRQDGAGPP